MRLTQKILTAALVLIFTGCVNIDYVGQKLTPLPEDQLVTFFSEKQNVPTEQFAMIGRAEVSAPDGTDSLSIKEKLQDKAREIGADAVKIVAFNRVKVGTIQVSGSGSEPDSAAMGYTSRTVGGDPVYTDSFGRTSAQPSRIEDKYEVLLQVQFFAERAKFDAAMMERTAERAAAIQAEIEAEEAAMQDFVPANADNGKEDNTIVETEVEENATDGQTAEQVDETVVTAEDTEESAPADTPDSREN